MPGNGNKAGMEDEQKGGALSPPELAQKDAPARRSATWTCWETPSQASLAHHTRSNSALVGICRDASRKLSPISRSYFTLQTHRKGDNSAHGCVNVGEFILCKRIHWKPRVSMLSTPATSRSRKSGLVSVPPVSFIQICVIFGRVGHL